MKKIITLLMSTVMCLSVVGCSGNDNSKNDTKKQEANIEIKLDDGTTEKLTSKEFFDKAESNTISFEKKYIGSEITVIGEVEKVGANMTFTNFNHTCLAYVEVSTSGSHSWTVEVSPTNPIIETLEAGDAVKVTGKLTGVLYHSGYMFMSNTVTPSVEIAKN